ncbi:MAG: hypothetical protein K2M19_06355 [Muribaculaceae bacterium]|nr:hypothetical protein [Muribaculaceae bacterium]
MKISGYIRLIVTSIAAICIAGCQNEGPIGYKFGVWRIDSYSADGIPVTDILVENTTIAFQGGAINVIALRDNYMNSFDQYGSWTEEGNTLYLNFTHSDDNHPAGSDFYAAPYWLGWTSEEVMAFEVEKHSNREMTWRYISPAGVVNIYKLHKTW